MTGHDQTDLDRLRIDLALACRVMAVRGLVDDVLGHISHRVGQDELLVRCRGPEERGLLFTDPADICLVGMDGVLRDSPDHRPPAELPIHTELLTRRPDVSVVVHAHPRDVVVADLAGLSIRPLVGAFNIPAMRLAEKGISIYPRSVLIRRTDLASEMADVMGSSSACILTGHGLVTTGATVAQAVLRALDVKMLARLSLDVASAGGTCVDVPSADRAELPDLGAEFNEALLWRHHLARLDADGFGLDGDP